jgi:formylglycine-generating enzyme required for sulfatase activity
MSSERRSLRGGSWNDLPVHCRSACRPSNHPAYVDYSIGFRVVRLSQPTRNPMSQISRLLRGGSWYGSPRSCRSACRSKLHPAFSYFVIGFRVVRLPQPTPSIMSQILRVLRGGSCLDFPVHCRSACRLSNHPAYAYYSIGFRVVRLPQPTLRIMARISRLLRGNSWFSIPQYCRSAYRIRNHPAYSIDIAGFRVASQDSPVTAIAMVKIPAGNFLMGSPTSEESHFTSESPQHEVNLGSFWMSQTPITQAQWVSVMGANPSHFKGNDLPVEQVSWHDAMEFCRRLSEQTGHIYTLPSEAQWEYACRAGTTTPFYFGNTITPDQANYDGNYTYNGGPRGEYRRQTTPVGMFPPNDWGLYDMHGNVWEWCLDTWHPNYEGAPADGSAWEGGDE